MEGPNAGKLLAASDTSTRWDYLYALDASLNAQGQLEIRYSQDALNAGLSGAYTLLPGMQAQLNPTAPHPVPRWSCRRPPGSWA